MGYTLSIIGPGVMGKAVLSAIYNAPAAKEETKSLIPTKIITCSKTQATAEEVEKMISSLGKSPNNITVESIYDRTDRAILEAQVLVLAVKPYMVEEVLKGYEDMMKEKFLISVVAGWTLEKLSKYTSRVSRVVTNTPARYGQGMVVVSHYTNVTEDNKNLLTEILGHMGPVVVLDEKHTNAATALVGSGPAFVLLMIESFMEAGIKLGIPMNMALEFAINTFQGTAKMLKITNEHPTISKYKVCTPGGITIAGLGAMEDGGVKSDIIKGISEACKKSEQMGKDMD